MKSIMCYCLAMYMVQHGSSEMECTEPQLLLKETYCGLDSLTSLTMYTFNEELKVNVAEAFTNEGCSIDFNEPYLNDTISIECDITETDCFDDDIEVEKVKSDTYILECEDIDLFGSDGSSEIYSFRNDSTTDFINATVAIDAIFSHDNAVTTDNTSTFDVSESESTISETNVFRNETTTDLAILLKDATANSSDAIFSSENSVTNDTWSTFDVFESGSTTSETNVFRNETTTDTTGFVVLDSETSGNVLKKVNVDPSDSSKMLPILGYSAAASAAIVGMAFGTYKLRSLMQSGRYLLPDTPSPQGFIELA